MQNLSRDMPKSGAEMPYGFNLIGHVSGNLGVSVTARNVIEVLLAKKFPVAIFDIDPGLGMGEIDSQFRSLFVNSPDNLPYAINLFVLPPKSLVWALTTYSSLVLKPGCLNIAFSMWELTVLPNLWKSALEFFDILVAESDFIRYAFEFNLSEVITIPALHPVYLPKNIQPNRQHFGLQADKTIFITAFEPQSDPQRKNPFAVLEAFQRGLAANTDANLVFKVNNAYTNGELHPSVQALKDISKNDPRIQLIAESLSYVEVLRLYASCDVFVSLHRSEGLGLVPMEMMALGKPVIATGWSGNMTYMDHTNSCLVGYRLIPVDGTISAYKEDLANLNAVWAEPNIEEAAAWMSKLAGNSNLRAMIGNKASKDMAQFQARAEEGHFIEQIRAIWEMREFLPTATTEHREIALKHLRKMVYRDWLSKLSLGKRVEKKVRDFLDKYLLWRFKS